MINMEFEAIIGLEIHVQMKTNSKMFSSAPVTFGYEPNTQADINDLSFPGSMPTINKQAVINAIRVCNALHMEIDDTLLFDRKNYFYSDLSKGYQITQQFRPIGRNGYLTIKLNGKDKTIGVVRLHIEEDACKQLHESNYSLLDYNRSGIPLLEIVSKPEIKSGQEAVKYVEAIRSIVTFLGVSDGKMEEGSLRVDINISLKNKNSDDYGTKVEIKNLNSLSNIQKAIDYEINRQSKLLESGDVVKQFTRRYDEVKKKTTTMRVKIDSIDYKYFTDSNLPPVKLSKEFIEDAIKSSPKLASTRQEEYKKYGLNDYDASLILSDVETANYFEKGLKSGCSAKLLANWINVEVQGYLNRNNISIDEFTINSEELGDLVNCVEAGEINSKQAKVLFNKMIETKKDAKTLIKDMGLTQESDINVLVGLVKEVIDNNPQTIIDYKAGKGRVVGFLVGQVMKKTNGKANPAIVNKLILNEMKRR